MELAKNEFTCDVVAKPYNFPSYDVKHHTKAHLGEHGIETFFIVPFATSTIVTEAPFSLML